MTAIVLAIAGASVCGFIMGWIARRDSLAADAARWRMLETLRTPDNPADVARVVIWSNDGPGRAMVSWHRTHHGKPMPEQIYRAATVDVALAQAVHAKDQAQ